MMEVVSKVNGVFREAIIALLWLALTTAKDYIKEEKRLKGDDHAPGDNFPYISCAGTYNVICVGMGDGPGSIFLRIQKRRSLR